MPELSWGITVGNHGDFADPAWLVDLAVAAEERGWDGVFVWDHVSRTGQPPMADPWITLAAIATRTSRVRLGPMVTPLPRRRPWKVAREVTTLDHLSGGRVILGVGLGNHAVEFDAVGEETDLRRRADMLDEALELLRLLWTGEPVTFVGEHYRVEGLVHTPTPVQPSIPIWVAGRWPNRRPMTRAARFDGAYPINEGGMTPEDFLAVARLVADVRGAAGHDRPFDLVRESVSPPGADVTAFVDAGLTWWLESMRPEDYTREAALQRVLAGPG